MISVSYEARDPKLAEEVLKALAAAYTEKHLEVHRPFGEFKFFDQQTEQYMQGLNRAQEKLTDFTKGTGVVSAQIERDSALQQAVAFDSNASQAQAALLETEERVRTLKAQLQTITPRMTTVVRSSDNPQLFEQLKSTLLNLELKRTELSNEVRANLSIGSGGRPADRRRKERNQRGREPNQFAMKLRIRTPIISGCGPNSPKLRPS